MSDQIKICQKCQSPFVYSEYEQTLDAKEKHPLRLYCPICQSIADQEKKRPAKPKVV